MPAQAVLLHRNFLFGFEVFAVKAQGLRGGRKEAAAREQNIMPDLPFAFLTEQCQARADIDHIAFLIDKVIFTEAQASL